MDDCMDWGSKLVKDLGMSNSSYNWEESDSLKVEADHSIKIELAYSINSVSAKGNSASASERNLLCSHPLPPLPPTSYLQAPLPLHKESTHQGNG
ncbi:UNVERIFIED_CONTAM: hypothetical protein Slati_2378000 [Sesamum latifolium]|uniref:Uncharacterized protein n=1 Tax=Sesamum latifolium TaxID=2727402 RepID=A0AAW2WCG5_9LAMI